MTRVSDTRRVRRRRGRRRGACRSSRWRCCAVPRSRALLEETQPPLGRPAVGRRHPRLRAARAARGAARGDPRRARRRSRSSPAAGRTRRASLEKRGHPDLPARAVARACCGCSSRTARAASSSRAASAAATSGRARASCCGTRWSTRCSTSVPAGATRRTATSSSPAASTTRARRRWSRRSPRRSPSAACKVGVLLGTAYLFTEEAVRAGRDRRGLPAGGAALRPHRAARDRARPRHPLRRDRRSPTTFERERAPPAGARAARPRRCATRSRT